MKNILSDSAQKVLCGRTKYIIKYTQKEIQGKKVLDIGCGYGWYEYHALKNRGVDHIWGIELSEKDLKTARAGVKDTRVSFQVGSAVDLPFQDHFFDCVVSWDVIEHIPPNMEMQMFSEICRVLKAGGVFWISTPYRSFWGTVLDPAWWLIRHRHYTRRQMKEIIESNTQLKCTEIQVRGGIWDILDILNMYIAKWVFHRDRFFENFFTRKIENEYKQCSGISTLFVKGRKIV